MAICGEVEWIDYSISSMYSHRNESLLVIIPFTVIQSLCKFMHPHIKTLVFVIMSRLHNIKKYCIESSL